MGRAGGPLSIPCKPAFGRRTYRGVSSEVVDPACIEHVIVNHVEHDHSGRGSCHFLPRPRAKIYASGPHGVNGLTAHYGDRGYVPVKTGDTLPHRQANAFLHSDHDGALARQYGHVFRIRPHPVHHNDAFGQHFASSEALRRRGGLPEVLAQRRNTTPTSSCRTRAMFKRRSSRSKGARST